MMEKCMEKKKKKEFTATATEGHICLHGHGGAECEE